MFYDIELTKSAFDKAQQVDGKVTEYRVKGKEHLRLIVNNVKRTLTVRLCFQGRRRSKAIGTYPHMRLSTFERLANEYCEHIQSGELNALAFKVTLTTFFYDAFLKLAQKNGKRSWKDDEGRFRLYVKDIIGHMILANIKSYHIQSLLNNLPDHLSDGSHDLIRALISVIFSTAIKYELLDKNPVKIIPARNNIKVRKRTLTNTEYVPFIKSLLIECDPSSDNFSFHCLALLLALLTGMRIGNCISLRRDMLSGSRDKIFLTSDDTKQKKTQTVPLSKQATWVINTAISMSWNEFVFPSTINTESSISYPRSAFRRVCKRAGIKVSGENGDVDYITSDEPLQIHSLRKSFCSTVMRNTDLVQASFLLGHSDISVTRKHYAFYQDEQLAETVGGASDSMLAGIPELTQLIHHN